MSIKSYCIKRKNILIVIFLNKHFFQRTINVHSEVCHSMMQWYAKKLDKNKLFKIYRNEKLEKKKKDEKHRELKREVEEDFYKQFGNST